jgi:hypothetical protein
MAIVETLPVTNVPSGTVVASPRPVPVGFQEATIQINCTTGVPATPFAGFAHPFSNAVLSITFGCQWSWDGGATFHGSTQGTQFGSPTGIWATDKAGNPVMTPVISLALPSLNGVHPNFYRPYGTVVGGPISFGLTVNETTG